MPKVAAEYIDRLCTVEMRIPGLPRGVASRLYEAARNEAGEALSYRAARILIEHCEAGEPIFITCAAGVPPWLPNGETDGPLGGAAIARTLALTRGAVPIFVSSDLHRAHIAATVKAAGFVLTEPETAVQRTWAAAILPFNEVGDARDTAVALIDRYQPKAMVAVETIGRNRAGIVHSSTGTPHHDAPAYDSLFEVAMERGIGSVGIGDAGNEIGFGRITEAVMEIQEYGDICRCECGKGMATVAKTDALVLGATSNWGAYGVAAMIALLSEKLDAFHDADMERRMLEACLSAGAVDGALCNHEFSVDGIPGRVHFNLVDTLGTMIRIATREVHRGF